MKTITKKLTLPKESYFETHLNLINCLLPVKLTPKEIIVLARFMCLEGDIANDMFGTSARKIIMGQLKLSPGGLGNYLKLFRDKGFIIEREDTTVILPILIPEKTEQLYTFKLEVDESKG